MLNSFLLQAIIVFWCTWFWTSGATLWSNETVFNTSGLLGWIVVSNGACQALTEALGNIAVRVFNVAGYRPLTHSNIFQQVTTPLKHAIWIVALALIAARHKIRWKTEEEIERQGDPPRMGTKLHRLPLRWMVLTGVIMVSMWRVGNVLSFLGTSWANFDADNGPFGKPRVRPHEPRM